MRYFKDKYFIYEATDDLTKWRLIYGLETREHLKGYRWHKDTRPDIWKEWIELTKKEVFIELL